MIALYKNWTIDYVPGNSAAYQATALVNGAPMQSPPNITDYTQLTKWIDAYPNPAAVTQYISPAAAYPGAPQQTTTPYGVGPTPAQLQLQAQLQAQQQRLQLQRMSLAQQAAQARAAAAATPVPVTRPIWEQPLLLAAVVAVAGFAWWKLKRAR